jgi:hypothetical protein
MLKNHHLLSALVSFCLLALSARAGLVCTNSTFDYGTVSAATSPANAFVLKNTGTHTVTITRVRASCGCVASAATKKIVAPGEQTEVKVRVSLAGRSGPQRKTVFVQTDSPETPQLLLEIVGVAQRAAAGQVTAPVTRPVVAGAAGEQPPAAAARSDGLRAVPYEIRLPAGARAQGLVTFVAIKDDAHPDFTVERVQPPAGVPCAVTKNRDGYILKLGPIADARSLEQAVVAVSTSSGELTLPFRIKTP